MSQESIVQLAAAAVAALALGGAVGFLTGRARREWHDVSDWKMRMAARDRDLSDTVERLAEAEVELQSVRDRVTASPVHDPEAEARIAALTEELQSADEELTRLRSLEVDKAPAASSDMARRLEALEVELSTLASMRCPDPSAHRRTAAPTPPRPAVPPADDDLTLITGIGPGLADLLRRLGYRTFRDIAAMGDDDLDEIARIAGDVVGPSAREGWVESARRLTSNDAA